MIEYGNLLICILLTYYTVFIFNLLFNKKYRNEIKHDNEKMSELRKIPIKSIEQQKEFLKYRHPINKKTSYLKFIGMIVLYLGLINLYKYILKYFNVTINLYIALVFIFVLPFIVNLLLRKFQLHKNDISTYIKMR